MTMLDPQILAWSSLGFSVAWMIYGISQNTRARFAEKEHSNADTARLEAVRQLSEALDQLATAEQHADDLSRSLQACEANYAKLERSNRTLKGNYTKLKNRVPAQGAAEKQKG